MTDKEIFERFMLWMGMKMCETKNIDKNTVIIYEDTGGCDLRFTKFGYDEFYTGAVFDETGKIITAYIDSHVAFSSNNCKLIDKLIDRRY